MASRCTRSACDDLLLDQTRSVGKTRLATVGDRAFVNVAPFFFETDSSIQLKWLARFRPLDLVEGPIYLNSISLLNLDF